MESVLRFLIDHFPDLMDLNLTASIVILFVICVRQFLKGVPKIFSYALWGIVLLRLLVPVSIESTMSFVPERTEFSSMVELNEALPRIEFESPSDRVSNQWIRENTPPGEPFVQTSRSLDAQTYLTFGWLAGMACMLLYSGISYWKLRRSVRVAVPFRKGIYIADDIDTPFVMGIFRPVIYLPHSLEPWERTFIIAHERHHIRRGDHIFKALGFLALTIHWFNPFVWAAFVLAGRDMEMSCDEAVIRKLGDDIRADYSATLLNLATGYRMFAGTPLAFGEGDPTGRVRNLAKWKKPAIWVIFICVVVCGILSVCLLTDPKIENHKDTVSFEDIPYDSVTMVELKNLHNGQYTHLFDQMEIRIICDFLKDISGTYAGSGKGYYEGTYQIQLFRDNAVIFSIGFGDTNTFYYGIGEDGYSERYTPIGTDIQEIIAFLSTYDSSGFMWPSGSEQQTSSKDWGVSIKPERVSRTGATAAFVYGGSVPGEEGAELTYDDFLALERLDNGTWVMVEELPGYIYYVGDSSYPVVDGYGMVHEWQNRFGELSDGHYRMGKLVTLTRPDGSEKLKMVYGEFSIPESILTGPIPLEDLPEKYSAEQAMLDGCLVCMDGIPKENIEAFREFADACNRGEAGFFRIVNWYYGEDPHYTVHDVHYDGSEYTVNWMESGDGRVSSAAFPYLKHFEGSKEQENFPYDAYDHYVLLQDDDITWQEIFDGKHQGECMPIFLNYISYPKMPQLPANPMNATLEFEGEVLITTNDFDRLEKIWILFGDAELLGYEPKTHSTGLGLHLILTGENGDTLTIDLDPDNDICRINGEFVFYGAYDEPCYIEKLWYYLGITSWPDIVYERYPNAYRP